MKRFTTLIFVIMFLLTEVSWGQILTFDFAGIAGNEVTVNSNSNDTRLTSSTISRGSEVTASANVDRFNSTNWTSSASIQANDYLEFSIIPQTNKKFSITSIVIQHQRSSSGPISFSLRYSGDSYASDLGGVQTISDVTTTVTSTFTFTLSNQTDAVTFRIYGYSSELAAGSWGPGDGAGNDIIVNGSTDDIVSNPTNFSVSYTSSSETKLTWSVPTSAYDKVLIFGREGGSVTYTPSGSGNSYADANSNWISAGIYNTDNKLLYSGTGTEVTISNLSNNTTYYFSTYSYLGSYWSTGTSTDATTASVDLVDSFSDGEYSSNPTWTGVVTWQVVTSSDVGSGTTNSNTLQIKAKATGENYLSTQRSGTWGTEQSWGIWIGRRSQAATSSNQIIYWLWANSSEINSGYTGNGYRIVYGDDSGNDEIILQKVSSGVPTTILTSSGSITNGITDYGFLLRITRSSSGIWTLYTSELPTTSGTGAIATDVPNISNTTVNQGSITDNTYTDLADGYIGIWTSNTNSTNAYTGAEFDQIYFSKSSSSLLPVELTSFTALLTDNGVKLNWETATEVNNYGFEIERGSASLTTGSHGKTWEKIGFVQGHGNSNSPKSYSFMDKSAPAGKVFYRLKQIDFDGKFEYSNVTEVNVEVPGKLVLYQNMPNPFNPATEIRFALPKSSNVELSIYNMLGEKVKTIASGIMNAGEHKVSFNAANLSSGVYFYKLTTESNSSIKKMILMK